MTDNTTHTDTSYGLDTAGSDAARILAVHPAPAALAPHIARAEIRQGYHEALPYDQDDPQPITLVYLNAEHQAVAMATRTWSTAADKPMRTPAADLDAIQPDVLTFTRRMETEAFGEWLDGDETFGTWWSWYR